MGLKLLILLTCMMIAIMPIKSLNDTAENQLIVFKEKTDGPIGIMTTAAGAPINDAATVTLNGNLNVNEYFLDSLTHFVRERIPARVVHTKGCGAFGYFEVTDDVTDICKAKLYSKIGKKTPVAVRFSLALEEKGGKDTIIDARGFAIKFYTEEGNFDLLGLSTPQFTVKDPLYFAPFVRSLLRNPATNFRDQNMAVDFLTLHPESLPVLFYILGDGGTPNGYRHMAGFPIHTYQVVNATGESFFIRFHFNPDQGLKNFTLEESLIIGGIDQDHNCKDLYNVIANGDFPTWTIGIQVLTANDVKNAGFDVFDVTKALPLTKYPLRTIGRLVLNKNPLNYFAEIEQLAFSPSNLVPGILGAPDKLFEARRLAYRETQYHRLGANFYKIPVNCPMHKTYTYNRDGSPPVKDNMKNIPNYPPNSFNGPVAYKEQNRVELVKIHEDPPDNIDQAREVYHKMGPGEKIRLETVIVLLLRMTVKFLQDRAINLLTLLDKGFGERIRIEVQGF